MKIGFIACLFVVPTLATAWEYRLVEDGITIYAEQDPPFDLTYPPPNQPTSFTDANDALQGAIISQQDLDRNLAKPQLIIIPEQKKLNPPKPRYQTN